MEYLHSINKQGGKLNGNERITSIEEMKKWKCNKYKLILLKCFKFLSILFI